MIEQAKFENGLQELWLCIGFEVFYQRYVQICQRLNGEPRDRAGFVGTPTSGYSDGVTSLPFLRKVLLIKRPTVH